MIDLEEGTAMPRYLLLICVLLTVTSTSRAIDRDTVYKWVDAAGETHYTQMPPQDREYEIMKQATPPMDDPARIRSDLQQQVEAMDKEQEKKKQQATEAGDKDRGRKLRKENCAIATSNLSSLNQGGNKQFMTPEGTVFRLTDEDRQQRIAKAEQQIKDYCDVDPFGIR